MRCTSRGGRSAGVPPASRGRAGRPRSVVLAILLALSAAAAPPTTDLDRLRGEIAKLKDRLEDVRRQKRTAQQELEEVDLELGIRTRELEIAEDMKGRLETQRKELEQQIAAIAPRIARQKQYLERRLVALYRLGGLSYLRMFLALDRTRDPIEGMSMLSFLISRDSRAVSRFQSEQQQLAVRSADLADRQKRLGEMHRVVEDRKRAVAASRAQQARLVASLVHEESGSARQLAALEEKERRLEHLVTVLSNQGGSIANASDIRAVQGALAWPVDGKVIERFGRHVDPKFATVTTNNGLKVAAAPGTSVRAVFQGTVLFSQWFKGYGNLIILDHGNRIFSLYGNLKAPAVGVGDRITTGQPIAGVGESEDVKSGYLYFEIRQDNKPEDPQKWLR